MKLKNKLGGKEKAYTRVLESNLTDIISPFSRKLSFSYLYLTPTEMQVANLIRQGTTTKEIADFMNLSNRTIEDHRKSIRRKLGIKNTKINLRSQLLSLQE
jgi:DNA-binding CsgD family transcriptional regulator